MKDEAKWRQPVGAVGQAAAGRGQHGCRDPKPSREELLIRLDWVLAIDAARADDRNAQSAIPEPVPHPANPHVCRHDERRKSRWLNERIARVHHDPEPGTAPATSSGPRRRVRPAISGRAGPRRRYGEGRRDRSTRRPGRPAAERPQQRLTRKEGTADAGSWCGSLRAARYQSSARASMAPGSPSGQEASAASSRDVTPAGSTSAARRSLRRDSTSLAQALAPRSDATRSPRSRTALHTVASRVRTQPSEKTAASAIAIAGARLRINGEAGRRPWRRPLVGRRRLSWCTSCAPD